jgi:hypothetical protein
VMRDNSRITIVALKHIHIRIKEDEVELVWFENLGGGGGIHSKIQI